MKLPLLPLCLGALLISACSDVEQTTPGETASPSPHPITATLEQNDQGHYQIVRDGEPYFIRGAGGTTRLEQLAQAGANSVRTWSTDDAQRILDEAQEHGLTVMLGLRMGSERHGFDYDDEEAVRQQKETIREQVLQFKDHPALLAWGLGNEVDLFYTNTRVWLAVEDIAKMIRELDPHHLITTVTAGIDQEKADLIREKAPSLDYLSVNVYGDLDSLPQTMRDIGWPGAYAVTEWGPTGHWEIENTEWEVPIEQTSTEKAQAYQERYEAAILGDPEKGLGSYAFLWGQKQETTPTWYGLFLESGHATEVVDTMQYLWTGDWPETRAPSIQHFLIDEQSAHDSIYLEPGQTYQVELTATHPQDDPFEINWEFMPESTDIRAGGDPEERPQSIEGLIIEDSGNGNMTFTAPEAPGPYRLFTYVTNEHNRAATANVPFFVREP